MDLGCSCEVVCCWACTFLRPVSILILQPCFGERWLRCVTLGRRVPGFASPHSHGLRGLLGLNFAGLGSFLALLLAATKLLVLAIGCLPVRNVSPAVVC